MKGVNIIDTYATPIVARSEHGASGFSRSPTSQQVARSILRRVTSTDTLTRSFTSLDLSAALNAQRSCAELAGASSTPQRI